MREGGFLPSQVNFVVAPGSPYSCYRLTVLFILDWPGALLCLRRLLLVAAWHGLLT